MGTASATAETASRRITDVFVSCARARRKRRILGVSFALPFPRRQERSARNRTARRVVGGLHFVCSVARFARAGLRFAAGVLRCAAPPPSSLDEPRRRLTWTRHTSRSDGRGAGCDAAGLRHQRACGGEAPRTRFSTGAGARAHETLNGSPNETGPDGSAHETGWLGFSAA
jgi:hypothetical protein